MDVRGILGSASLNKLDERRCVEKLSWQPLWGFRLCHVRVLQCTFHRCCWCIALGVTEAWLSLIFRGGGPVSEPSQTYSRYSQMWLGNRSTMDNLRWKKLGRTQGLAEVPSRTAHLHQPWPPCALEALFWVTSLSSQRLFQSLIAWTELPAFTNVDLYFTSIIFFLLTFLGDCVHACYRCDPMLLRPSGCLLPFFGQLRGVWRCSPSFGSEKEDRWTKSELEDLDHVSVNGFWLESIETIIPRNWLLYINIQYSISCLKKLIEQLEQLS